MAYLNFIILAGILTITGLYLHNWQPPIKPQYIAGLLLIFGLVLGWFMVANPWYGFLIAGLVYYKDKLVEEIKLVNQSFKEIKEEKEEE